MQSQFLWQYVWPNDNIGDHIAWCEKWRQNVNLFVWDQIYAHISWSPNLIKFFLSLKPAYMQVYMIELFCFRIADLSMVMIYVWSALVLVGCNVFWMFVVTMLLNTKSLLIATKQMVCSFCPKKYKQPVPYVFLNGVHVQLSELVKYLSVCMHASLKDDDDIQGQVKSHLGASIKKCSWTRWTHFA